MSVSNASKIFPGPFKVDRARFRDYPLDVTAHVANFIFSLTLVIGFFGCLVALMAGYLTDRGAEMAVGFLTLVILTIVTRRPADERERRIAKIEDDLMSIKSSMELMHQDLAGASRRDGATLGPLFDCIRATENVRHAIGCSRWKANNRDQGDLAAIDSFYETADSGSRIADSLLAHVYRAIRLRNAAKKLEAHFDFDLVMRVVLPVLVALSNALHDPICDHEPGTHCAKVALGEAYDEAQTVLLSIGIRAV